jgi:hypothetical protein
MPAAEHPCVVTPGEVLRSPDLDPVGLGAFDVGAPVSDLFVEIGYLAFQFRALAWLRRRVPTVRVVPFWARR